MVQTTKSPVPGLKPRYFRIICDILDAHLQGGECRVYLFGSRASDASLKTSDIDIAVKSSSEKTSRGLHFLRTAFEESKLPYRVDLVNLEDVSADFEDMIKKKGTLIWSR